MSTPEAQREYQRQWVAKRRAKWFTDKSCVNCGSVENLRLDHIDPKLKVNHRIWSWSWKKIEEEVVKCQVLCEGCHKDKTKKNYENYARATLSHKQVEEIRQKYATGNYTQVVLGEEYGIQQSAISKIVLAKRW